MIRRLILALTLLASPALAQMHTDVLDIHHLPLGDGKVSRQPAQGMLMSCQQQFQEGGGAREGVPWIHGKTWDLAEKMKVSGKIVWPQAQFAITIQGAQRLVSGNGLPVNEPTGTFPVPRTDPVYQWDFNPNSIVAQNRSFALPLNPTLAAQPSCVPGMVGVTVTGVALFDAFDAGGRDAVAHEAQDLCNGHPPPGGLYHYHGPSPCLPGADGNLALIGYAFDGFGIFSLYDANGRELTNADLDACHGRVDTIMWDGRAVAMYHYSLTREFPYTIGCFRGTPTRVPPPAGSGPPGGGRPGGPGGGPPGGGPPPFGRPPPGSGPPPFGG